MRKNKLYFYIRGANKEIVLNDSEPVEDGYLKKVFEEDRSIAIETSDEIFFTNTKNILGIKLIKTKNKESIINKNKKELEDEFPKIEDLDDITKEENVEDIQFKKLESKNEITDEIIISPEPSVETKKEDCSTSELSDSKPRFVIKESKIVSGPLEEEFAEKVVD